MPTWRENLLNRVNYAQTGEDLLAANFEESAYFIFYHGLLNNQKLLSKAEELGYELLFFPHTRMMPFVNELKADSKVKLGNLSMQYKANRCSVISPTCV